MSGPNSKAHKFISHKKIRNAQIAYYVISHVLKILVYYLYYFNKFLIMFLYKLDQHNIQDIQYTEQFS